MVRRQVYLYLYHHLRGRIRPQLFGIILHLHHLGKGKEINQMAFRHCSSNHIQYQRLLEIKKKELEKVMRLRKV